MALVDYLGRKLCGVFLLFFLIRLVEWSVDYEIATWVEQEQHKHIIHKARPHNHVPWWFISFELFLINDLTLCVVIGLRYVKMQPFCFQNCVHDWYNSFYIIALYKQKSFQI